MSDFQTEILDALRAKFKFKSEKGAWLQAGKCPKCNRNSAWCAADAPKVVYCDHRESCGWEESARDLLPELFEDWSKRFEKDVTPENPNAVADAYLRNARGLDLTGLRGAFTQEWFQDRKRNIGSATVRFALPNDTWWERIIDRPGRFDKKANFKFGGSYAGHWWQHPADSFEALAKLDELWLAEGIFDACSLRQNFPAADARAAIPARSAVSNMSISNYPEKSLAALANACAEIKVARPKLVFAYDPGAAAVEATKAHVKRARAEGWDATAAQLRPDGEGAKLDWNDLGLRHAAWKDEPDKAPFSAKMLDLYLWNGAVTIAQTVREKARLIERHTKLRSFDLRFNNRIYWAKVIEAKEEGEGTDLAIEEIANCNFRILYRERDEAADETNYFIRVDFPGAQPTAKARFTASCCAASGEFKKRLFAFSGMWSGTQDQLDRIMRAQTRALKTVEPLHATGYSAAHQAWVLGDIAVRDGRVIPINRENCFDFGKQAVKLSTTERLLEISYDPDRFGHDIEGQPRFAWTNDLWTAWGPRAIVTLAFFTATLFVQQIREKQKTFGFLEITGPPGSGKSTLVEFYWKLMGRAGYEGFDPNKATTAAIARNFQKVANLPVGLIEGNRTEGRAAHARQFDWNELLTLYNGRSPRSTGRKSGGTETFEPPFLGSIYLMQNERIDAMDAVLERLMSFHIDKAGWSPATKAAALRIETWPMEQLSGFIVHAAREERNFLPFYFKRFAHHDADLPKRVPGLHNSRAIKCHAQLAAAVESLAHLLPVKAEWIAEALRLVDWMAMDRQQSSGADHPLVQRFWEQVDYLESIEKDDAVRPINLHRKRDEMIAISLPHYEERCRAHGQTPVPAEQLHKVLTGSKVRKFVGKTLVNCIDDQRRHCWIFQQPASPTANGPI